MVLRYYIPRLAQCLPVAHHGNWVPCGPRLICAGSRSGLEPQRYCAHGPLVCGTRPGTYQSNHLLPCRLCFFRQRLRESTLTENPVWSPVGRLAVMAGSWQLLQLMKYSDYSTMCFSWFPSKAERRVMMLGQLMALLLHAQVTSVPTPKSWSDECVVTVAGAGWHWEPLATSLHPRG